MMLKEARPKVLVNRSFKSLTFQDIAESFRNGVRNSDKSVLNVQTYYSWIKEQRQLIWNESNKEPERQDKRLHYRNRNNTGLKSLENLLK